jgi:hypothetical protein
MQPPTDSQPQSRRSGTLALPGVARVMAEPGREPRESSAIVPKSYLVSMVIARSAPLGISVGGRAAAETG